MRNEIENSMNACRLRGWLCLAAIAVGIAVVVPAAAQQSAPAESIFDQLPPPARVELPALPPARGPQPRELRAPDKLPVRFWPLPAAEFPRGTQVLPAEREPVRLNLPALEVPDLAAETKPKMPREIMLPTSARAFVAAPDPRVVPSLARFARDAEPHPRPDDEPSALAGRQILLASRLVPSPAPAPPQPLAIPDPFALVRSVRLVNPPPDDDPPVVSLLRPAPPRLVPPPDPTSPSPDTK